MFHLEDVILLGDSRLYETCKVVEETELETIKPIVEGMDNVV